MAEGTLVVVGTLGSHLPVLCLVVALGSALLLCSTGDGTQGCSSLSSTRLTRGGSPGPWHLDGQKGLQRRNRACLAFQPFKCFVSVHCMPGTAENGQATEQRVWPCSP